MGTQNAATIVSYNPANTNVLGEVPVSGREDVRRAVARARAAQPAWNALGVAGRVKILRKLCDYFQATKEKTAAVDMAETGKPIDGSLSTVDWALNQFRWQLDQAEHNLAPETTFENAEELHQIYFEPYGVAAVIAPWNFPLSNFVMGAVQPLIAGNTVVYKVSEEVVLYGREIDEAIRASGLPEGVFNQVYGAGDVGEELARSEIDFLHFTGSSATGEKLYRIAGEKFIPVTLELGGSDAGIVFEDADLSGEIVESIFWAKFVNCGQICCGLKRLFVHESRYDELVEKLRACIEGKKLGDPREAGVVFGPLAAKRQQELLIAQMDDARAKGAQFIMGGGVPPAHADGAYYQPTLLTGVTEAMRIFREEVFGPVLPIYTFKDEQDVIARANDTAYGLSAYVFTGDRARYLRVAQQLQAGSISHNGVDYSHPANPFGGYKRSGMGKTGGRDGLRHCCRIKVISTRK